MRVRNAKKIITVLLVIMITIFCATTLISITSFVISNPAQRDIEGAEDEIYAFGETKDPSTDDLTVVYDFLDNSIYNQYSSFSINSKKSFYTFCALTMYLDNYYSYIDGFCPFSGKTVYLNCDLNMNGESYTGDYDLYRNFSVFGGTFDGQGHTISNIYRQDSGSYGGAFCSILYGTIKNLKFENIYTLATYSSGNSVIGVVAGFMHSNATVENCIVKNAKYTSNKLNSDCFTAGIVGVNGGTIKNCLVDTIYIAGYDNNIWPLNPDGMKCYPFCVDNSSYKDRSTGKVEGCILKGGIKIDNSVLPTNHTDSKFLEAKPIVPSGTKGTDYGGTYQYCYSAPNNVSGLSYSAEGGTVDETGTAWYYYSGYNGGWPQLRAFMKDWTTINFSASTGGSVSPTSIKIPSDVTSYSAPSYRDQLIILDQQITASPNSGYSFSEWKKNSLTSWTVLFDKIPDELSFGEPEDQFGNLDYYAEGYFTKWDDEYGGFYGDPISIGTKIEISLDEIEYDGWCSESIYTLRFYSSEYLDYYTPMWEFEYEITWPYPAEPINVDYYISNGTIIPIFEVETYQINFEAVDGAYFESDYGSSWEFLYGDALNYWFVSPHEIYFEVDSYVLYHEGTLRIENPKFFEGFEINGSPYEYAYDASDWLSVEEDLTIRPIVETMYKLTFTVSDPPADIEVNTPYIQENIYYVYPNTGVDVTAWYYEYYGKDYLSFEFYNYDCDYYDYITYNFPPDYYNVSYKVNNGNEIDLDSDYYDDFYISEDTNIEILFNRKQCTVTFDWDDGIECSKTFDSSSGSSSDGTTQVDYETSISWTITTSQAVITVGAETITFTAKDGYEIDYVTINGTKYYPGSSGSTTITGNFEVYVYSIALFEVTFNPALDENNKTGHASLTAGINPIQIRPGSSLTATYSGYTKGGTSTITYKYNGTIVATYTLNRYYVMDDNCQETWNLTNISKNEEVTPIIKFYACTVTMENTSKDANDSNKAMATMSVTNDSYGTVNDGVFVVEYDTAVSVTTNGNVYTYTFTGGQVVTYTTTDKYEIDKYGINGTATSYTFSNKDKTSKTISPEFKLKTRNLIVNIIKDGDTTTNSYPTYYSAELTYSANLSLSGESHFTYSSDTIGTTKLNYPGYFVESFTIAGTTVSEDGKVVSDTKITVTNDITLTILFNKFFEVTFEEALDENNKTGHATLSAGTNPIAISLGSCLTATYSGYTRGETSTITYKYNGTIVATYTLEHHYIMDDNCQEAWDLNTNNLDTALSNEITVTPIIKFYPCVVTM